MRNEPRPKAFAVALAAFSLLVSSLSGSPPPAQPTGSDAASPFTEVVDVQVVNLEIVVTDSEGRRVHGLGPRDFVLEVDRSPVPIEYFTEVRDGAVAATEAGVSAVPAAGSGGAVSTHYLVFIDEYFAVARDRDRALDDLIAQLPAIAAADRMAILAWNGGKLEMLSDWSGSASDLRRVLETARKRPTSGLQRDLELSRPTRDPRTGRVPSGDPYTDPENLQQVHRLKERVERVMRAATTALRSAPRPAGRKAMLLLAGGWPYNPWDRVVPGEFDPRRFSDTVDYGAYLYRQLSDVANRLGYTLYPVDVRSLGAGARTNATLRSAEEAQYELDLATAREWSEHSTLTHLADQTGGRAFLGGRSRTALEQVIADTRSYYWLGFTPAWAGADRRHRLEVRARDPRLEVRSRQSYSDLSRRTEVDMTVESALLFGDPPGPRLLAAKLEQAQPAGRRKVRVPLTVAVPLGAVTFVRVGESWTAEVEMRVAMEDQHGDRTETTVSYLRFDSPSAPDPGRFGLGEATLKMRRLRHDIVVSVYDPLSGRILWSRLEFDPRGD